MSKKQTIPPCPYCADPSMFAPAAGKATDETATVVRLPARFWKDGRPVTVHTAKLYGERWIVDIPGAEFAEQYHDFSVRLIGVDVGFPDSPPMPFGNHVVGHRRKPPAVQAPYTPLTTVGLAMFSAFVMENDKGTARVEAHWWPSHEWIVRQQVRFTGSEPEVRKGELETTARMFEFFQLDSRGAPKITESGVRDVIKRLGPRAQQKEAARVLNVTERTLERWRARQGLKTWREALDRYA